MTVMRAVVLTLLVLVLVSCTTTEPQPDPGPQPEPPAFRRCQTCEGTQCVVVWIGQKTCKAEEDEQGRFCIAQGSCVIGTFGAVSVPTSDDDPSPLPPLDDEVRAVQGRFNALFESRVVENLRGCWGDLEGEGAVTIEHDYVRVEQGDWQPSDLRVVHSSLADGQRAVADKCMRQAVDGISLPYDAGEGDADELLLIWTWAVPLPD